MFDNEYSMDSYNFIKTSIIKVMRNQEMLKFVPDHLKIKNCVSMQLKNYLIYQDMLLINTRLNKCVMKLLYIMVEH